MANSAIDRIEEIHKSHLERYKQVLEQRNRRGAKVSGTEKKLLEIYHGWESRVIDAFRILEADIEMFPKRVHMFSLEEKKKGLLERL